MWIIDFGANTPAQEAALYERPFAHVVEFVKPARDTNNDASRRKNWWRFGRSGADVRAALEGLPRYITTPEVSKHRVFVWANAAISPDSKLMVIARDDDAMFGVLSSRFHEVWALANGSLHGVGNDPRYTPTTTFETFPFPEGLTPDIPAQDYADNPHAVAIADASRALVDARARWLNPPEWVDWERTPEEVAAGFPARPVAKPGHEAALKKRTLTNLYNERPAWLDILHRSLDEAVAAAYGWEWPLTDDEILRRLFELNQARGAAGS